METDLITMLTIAPDGTLVNVGDAVTDQATGHRGVLQSVLSNGMVTVSTGPGRVAVTRPGRYGLTVSGLGTCGCAVTHRDVIEFRASGWCAWHTAMDTMEPMVPPLDDLL